MINVRRATIEDIPMIMEFLDEHWLKGYALANNRELFDWQFVRGEKVNIWIGVDDNLHTMYAMQGAILYSNNNQPDVSGMLWIAIKSEDPMLAVKVGCLMSDEVCPRYIVSPGLVPRVAKLYRTQGFDVVPMDHFYRLGNWSDYKIAVIRDKIIPMVCDSGFSLEKITSMQEFKNSISEEILINDILSKNYRYIEWRYFNHPVFSYDLWRINNEKGYTEGVLVTREERANGSKSCKIVDFYGKSELFQKISSPIDNLIIQNKYEYVDIYSFGVDEKHFIKGGFLRCDNSSENIITNHFQPYVPQNTDIYMINPYINGLRVFRGDGDQDKPRY